jgi:hypothetical protein
MSNMDDLIAQVQEASIPNYMKTKGEIWEYFLDKNNGDKTEAASDAARELSGESSGKVYKNARRNFEERKGQLVGARQSTAKWRAFGKTLPPISYSAPEGGYIVKFYGWILIAGEYCEMRDFTISVTGDDAEQMAVEPALAPVFDAYFDTDGLAEETCGEWDVTVTAA